MLADRQIARMVDQGQLVIDPFVEVNLQPASYDMTLGDQYRVKNQYKDGFLDCREIEEGHTQLHEPERDKSGPYIDLKPGMFILSTTREEVMLPDSLAARVEGKSSLGRLGFTSHVTAGFIDPGFQGNITLEIANVGPWTIRLRPGMRIAQIAFFRMEETPRHPYGKLGHYQGQVGPTESKYKM